MEAIFLKTQIGQPAEELYLQQVLLHENISPDMRHEPESDAGKTMQIYCLLLWTQMEVKGGSPKGQLGSK